MYIYMYYNENYISSTQSRSIMYSDISQIECEIWMCEIKQIENFTKMWSITNWRDWKVESVRVHTNSTADICNQWAR